MSIRGSNTPMLSVHLSAGYGVTQTLSGVQFMLKPGERVGVVGTSGAGKSTLVQALLGLLPWRNGWADGDVFFHGINLLASTEQQMRQIRGCQIALVPQSPLTSLNPALTLLQHFHESWRAHMPHDPERMQCRISELMEKVQLPAAHEFLCRKPMNISVGQAQRVLIALALLHRPALLIADEPTSALDVCTQEEILKLFYEVTCDTETSLLYVSHDLVSVFRLCDRMLVINQGELVDDIVLSTCTFEHAHAATRALLQTLPVPPDVLRQHLAKPETGTSATQGKESQPGLPDAVECVTRVVQHFACDLPA